MRLLQKLLLICGLASFAIGTPQPARAQSDVACFPDSTGTLVKPDVILDCLRAGEPVSFDGITVEGDLDLTALNGNSGQSTTISSPLVIRNSHFTGSLISFNADIGTVVMFQEPVDLRGSQFDGSVDFTGAVFEEFAHFENIHFEAGANFTQAAFQNGSSFHKTIFNDSSSFMLANISGGLDFSEAQFFTLANFSWLHSTQSTDPLLQTNIDYAEARFNGGVYFIGAVFENPVLFNDAVFNRISPDDAVVFSDATFTALDLTNANFDSGQLEMSGQRYEKLIMPNFHPSILVEQNSVEALSKLKENFQEQEKLDIANEIAYWQHGLERKEKKIVIQILEIIFLDWTFGYGLKPLHAIMTSFSLILFFAIFYYPAGTLRPATFAPSKPRERKLTIRLSEIPIAHDEETTDASEKNQHNRPFSPQILQAWQAIAFSFGIFTKLSMGKYVAIRAGSLVIAEWVIGLMMMAGFLFSLANTNPLLRSVLDLLK